MAGKVNIVFFGPLSKNENLINRASFNNEIVEEIAQNQQLGQIVCMDYTGLQNVKGSDVFQFSGSPYSRIAYFSFKIISGLHIWTERTWMEYFFDIFAKKSIRLDSSDTLLLLRISCPRLVRKAKSLNMRVVGIMSIYPLNLISSKVINAASEIHIKEFSDYTSKKRISIYNRTVSRIDKLISLSSSLRTKALLNQWEYRDKLTFPTDEFGPDPSIFRPKQNKPTSSKLKFLATTDDSLKKGLPYLLVAWEKLSKTEQNMAELTVVGNLGKRMKLLVDKYQNNGSILFKEYSLRLHELYQTSDVFICPSIIDMGPRTIKQALCCGLPVISSDQCGASDFVKHGKSGFTYPYQDVDQLYNYIAWCLNHKAEVKAMGQNAFMVSKMFNNRKFAKNILSLTTEY